MKKTILLTFFAIALIACGGEDKTVGSSSKSEPAAATKKKPDGEKIYKNYCVTCHGISGDMGASGAFDLSVTTLTKEECIQVISKGRNLMTPFEALLSPEKIEAVAEYVGTLKK